MTYMFLFEEIEEFFCFFSFLVHYQLLQMSHEHLKWIYFFVVCVIYYIYLNIYHLLFVYHLATVSPSLCNKEILKHNDLRKIILISLSYNNPNWYNTCLGTALIHLVILELTIFPFCCFTIPEMFALVCMIWAGTQALFFFL